MEKSKALLEFLAKNIVENPDQVFVEGRTDEMGVLLTLHVAGTDMGNVIGKGGTTAKALRWLLRVVGTKENARVNLKIAEPEGTYRAQRA